MSITIDFSPADMAMIEEQATLSQVSVDDFIKEAVAKAARNAAYLAELDARIEEVAQGKVVTFGEDEWEKFINEKSVQ